MDIEIRRGLTEARLLAAEHWQPLLAYVVLGVLVPFLLLSSEPIFNLRAIMAIIADPFTYRVSGSITGPLYLLGIVGVLASGALLAGWNALLAEMREGYISEIMYGMVAGTAYLVVNLIFYFCAGLALSLPILLLGEFAETARFGTALAIVRHIASALASAWISARFCLVGPVMAAGGKLEPVSAFVESWRRTRMSWRRLFALYLAIYVLTALLTLALLAPHIFIVFNSPQGGLADMAMSGGWIIFWAAYFLMTLLIPAGLYRASGRGTPAEVFA
ncbi:MAG: hypothetical protein JHC57_22305 [Sphingopyxis sp.]|uniref:hypothetical protein n=1 Tax=Sphingopyxis sp. TaxID=1908224 RepID=UPI001A23BE75|nr:hypothetical protein [Sphingopyxis sp.]MBJ7502501.1 hypothetical protein [Sphingopyxis sp.]